MIEAAREALKDNLPILYISLSAGMIFQALAEGSSIKVKFQDLPLASIHHAQGLSRKKYYR